MEVVTTGAVRHAKLQSGRHHQQTNMQLSTGRMPFLLPNQPYQSTEWKKYHILQTCSSEARIGFSDVDFDH